MIKSITEHEQKRGSRYLAPGQECTGGFEAMLRASQSMVPDWISSLFLDYLP